MFATLALASILTCSAQGTSSRLTINYDAADLPEGAVASVVFTEGLNTSVAHYAYEGAGKEMSLWYQDYGKNNQWVMSPRTLRVTSARTGTGDVTWAEIKEGSKVKNYGCTEL